MSLAERLIEKFDAAESDIILVTFIKKLSAGKLDVNVAAGGMLHFYKTSAYSMFKTLSEMKLVNIEKYPMLLDILESICGEVKIEPCTCKYRPNVFYKWLIAIADSAEDIKVPESELKVEGTNDVSETDVSELKSEETDSEAEAFDDKEAETKVEE